MPDVKDPIIATAYIEDIGSWKAAIWDEKRSCHTLLFSVTESCESVIDAMRALLRLTSTMVGMLLGKEEDINQLRVFHKTSGGVMYYP